MFVESVLWDINPFDQWGVELGKKICTTLLPLGQAPMPAELADLAGTDDAPSAVNTITL